MRRGLLQIVAVGVFLASCSWLASASDQYLEYDVKAAFLYNFAKFVEWPPNAFATPEEPFAICVAGKDPFGTSLDRTLVGRSAHGRAIMVRKDVASDQVAGCHLLFIAGSEATNVAQIVHSLSGASVLTVGESPGFLDAGGVIGLLLDEGKVRFEINEAVAQRAGLRLSSQILKLARSVRR
jgi:hypothetical protein